MERLNGYVENVIFRNDENGYTVFTMISEEEEYTCVGSFDEINQGLLIEAEGDFTSHNMYGEQFQITSYEVAVPKDKISIEKYLGSGAVKGIGPSLAARIVKKFGEKTFEIIEKQPERLGEIKGISQRKAMEISQQIEDKKDLRQAMIFLQHYGISNALALKIFNRYGNEIYTVIKENPYQLADDIQGVGFKIADEIAVRVGIYTDSDFRIKSGILYSLLQGTQEGHTFLPYEELIHKAKILLNVDRDSIISQIDNLMIERKIIRKEDEIYSSNYYYIELNTARMLHDLNIDFSNEESEINFGINHMEKNLGFQLGELQKEAVAASMKRGVFLLTGGPGTGKTTTINAMLKLFELEGLDVLLGAPTGRAAKRMTEATGYEAKTIHRLLEVYGGMDDSSRGNFERNEQNPLETDAVIIDEVSMIDIHLIHALLKSISVGTRLILVGDTNQLPSVGPGSVLRDIIESKEYSMVTLNQIFRQAKESDIVVNAHKINQGEEVLLDNKSKDFFFLKRYDTNVILRVLLSLIQDKLPSYVNAGPLDIQVLTPMRKGNLGVEKLNEVLQKYLNPEDDNKKEKEHSNGIFREGDKVMQIKNNYQLEWTVLGRNRFVADKGLGVFNGDLGIIKEINFYGETLVVEFEEGKLVEYSFKQLDELELAYAITIHKSQGSEYPAVVMPLLTGPSMLMNRNLLYTAVTRAKKCVTIVGSEKMFFEMISNISEQKRYTGLKNRIVELKKENLVE